MMFSLCGRYPGHDEIGSAKLAEISWQKGFLSEYFLSHPCNLLIFSKYFDLEFM
jgi:hypothetical protein